MFIDNRKWFFAPLSEAGFPTDPGPSQSQIIIRSNSAVGNTEALLRENLMQNYITGMSFIDDNILIIKELGLSPTVICGNKNRIHG